MCLGTLYLHGSPSPISERRELCAHPFIELYDNASKRILFTGPLEQQDSFYVPEVLQEDEELSAEDLDMVGGAPSALQAVSREGYMQ